MMTKKKILLGITGGIAAYKAPELIRQLLDKNFEVKVVVTEAALVFVSQLTLETLLPNAIYCDFIEPEMQHIKLAKWADAILIAPITANSMAKICYGFAEDLLSALCLATQAPIVMVPAMNQAMWHHDTTQKNVSQLKARGIRFLGPESGEQACGDNGLGRMCEPQDIVDQLQKFSISPYLEGVKILMTMGATQEAIDPVRFISNKSSGKMGYALSQAASLAGANVTVIAGEISTKTPSCSQFAKVTTAKEMYAAVHNELDKHDIFISVAAVSDYEVSNIAPQKLKRGTETVTLILQPTIDILASACQKKSRPFIVGFAAETENIMENAKKKLAKKGADMLVVNDVSQPGIGFESDNNAVSVLHKDKITHFNKRSKQVIADEILKLIFSTYQSHLPTKG